MIKLNYKILNVNGRLIKYAKYRKNRSIRLSINPEGELKITCPYLTSEQDAINFILSKEEWIKNSLENIRKKTNNNLYRPLTKLEKIELYNMLFSLVKKYMALMNTTVSHITIRDMKTLWGSCTFKTHRLHFSTKLYFMNDDFIEYVVVHEMAHIFVPNHSREFYEIVKKYIPNYKIIRKLGK